MHLYKNQNTCDLNFIVKNGGLLKITGSHVHSNSGSIWEMVLDGRYYVAIGHWWEVIYSPSSSSNCDDLECTWRSFVDYRPIQV